MSFMDRMNEVVDNSKLGDQIQLEYVSGDFEVDEMGEVTIKSGIFEFIVINYHVDSKASFKRFEKESDWCVNGWEVSEGNEFFPESLTVDIDYSDGGMTLSKFEESGAAEMVALILSCL